MTKALERRALIEQNKDLRQQIENLRGKPQYIGESPAFRRMMTVVDQVADSSATVLLIGESGTGKEGAATKIHERSARRRGPFVAVNCAALPEQLLESELFGYEKGAFTGAVARKEGRFELADGGTLFLDEVADLSPVTQPKILRVLQEGEFERLGGTKTIKVDVRVIAATNQDLSQLVREKEKRFREDLYYRLNVITIRVPPLRERREDIRLLAQHFVQLLRGQEQPEARGPHRGCAQATGGVRVARQRARAGERDRARRGAGAGIGHRRHRSARGGLGRDAHPGGNADHSHRDTARRSRAAIARRDLRITRGNKTLDGQVARHRSAHGIAQARAPRGGGGGERHAADRALSPGPHRR